MCTRGHGSAIDNSQHLEAAKCLRWIDLHKGILLSYKKKKKKEILTFVAAWMKLENIIMLSETSQSEKDKYRMISLICGT